MQNPTVPAPDLLCLEVRRVILPRCLCTCAFKIKVQSVAKGACHVGDKKQSYDSMFRSHDAAIKDDKGS